LSHAAGRRPSQKQRAALFIRDPLPLSSAGAQATRILHTAELVVPPSRPGHLVDSANLMWYNVDVIDQVRYSQEVQNE